MITRRYVVVMFVSGARLPKLVDVLNSDGIRAFALPTEGDSEEYDVFVDAADVDQAAFLWKKVGFRDYGVQLLERRSSVELPRQFERMVLRPGKATELEVKLEGRKTRVTIPAREYRDD